MKKPTPPKSMLGITRKILVARMKKQLKDIEEHFATVRHWNANVRKESEENIDPDPGGVLARMAGALRYSLLHELKAADNRVTVEAKRDDDLPTLAEAQAAYNA